MSAEGSHKITKEGISYLMWNRAISSSVTFQLYSTHHVIIVTVHKHERSSTGTFIKRKQHTKRNLTFNKTTDRKGLRAK